MKKGFLVVFFLCVTNTVCAETGWKKGQTFPDLLFEDSNGIQSSIHAHKGKVLFLNFWASWCSPCIKEWPAIEEIVMQLGKEFPNSRFILLNMYEPYEVGLKWARKKGYHAPLFNSYAAIRSAKEVLISANGESLKYGAYLVPTSYVIDKSGVIVRRFRNQKPWLKAVRKTFIKAGADSVK